MGADVYYIGLRLADGSTLIAQVAAYRGDTADDVSRRYPGSKVIDYGPYTYEEAEKAQQGWNRQGGR